MGLFYEEICYIASQDKKEAVKKTSRKITKTLLSKDINFVGRIDARCGIVFPCSRVFFYTYTKKHNKFEKTNTLVGWGCFLGVRGFIGFIVLSS